MIEQKEYLLVRNPATQEIIGKVPKLTDLEVMVAVVQAGVAQKRWAATPVRERLKILARFAELLCEQKDSVAAVISREAGKPEAEALSTEILVVLDTVKYLQNHVPAFLKPEPVPHGKSGDEAQRRHAAARALRSCRHYQPVELSVQFAVDTDADRACHWQRRGAEAI